MNATVRTFRGADSAAALAAAKKALEGVVQGDGSWIEALKILADDYTRRGRIEGMELRGTSQIIKAMTPLSEMFGYATELRSRTQGRGSFTMHFGRYEEVPRDIASEINDLTAQINNLTSQISALTTQISALTTQISTISSQITSLNSAMNATVAQLNAQVTQINADIKATNAQITALKAQLKALK